MSGFRKSVPLAGLCFQQVNVGIIPETGPANMRPSREVFVAVDHWNIFGLTI
jgi:hypothetical protein